MFVLIDKETEKAWLSKSKWEISEQSGVPYTTLKYYSRKPLYIGKRYIFIKGKVFKSKQGMFQNNLKNNKK